MEYFKINPEKPDKKAIEKAIEVLGNGGIIAYPTDTLYGLGIDVTNDKAVHKLYLLKQRDLKLPVSLMVNSLDKMEELVGILPIELYSHLNKILPGKVTALIKNAEQVTLPIFEYLEKNKNLPEKIGFRIPDHPVCHALTTGFENPVSTTSANISGKGNVFSIKDVIAQFGNKLDLILDAGELEHSEGSTIVDFTKDPYLIVRQGDLSASQLEKILPDLTWRKKRDIFTITFVCSGNICRSPMAEGILKHILSRTKYKKWIRVRSAGTLMIPVSDAHEFAIDVMKEKNIEIAKHRSSVINSAIMAESDLVIAMAYNHYKYLRENFPGHKEKVVLIKQWHRENRLTNPSIADPIGHDIEFFNITYTEIYREIKRILPHILKQIEVFADYNNLV
ncbi:MAG: L-threonylcarbamoyladenylate synthase [Calditrichaceae bacterium]